MNETEVAAWVEFFKAALYGSATMYMQHHADEVVEFAAQIADAAVKKLKK